MECISIKKKKSPELEEFMECIAALSVRIDVEAMADDELHDDKVSLFLASLDSFISKRASLIFGHQSVCSRTTVNLCRWRLHGLKRAPNTAAPHCELDVFAVVECSVECLVDVYLLSATPSRQ
jgi:hypothetical protein